MKRSRSTAVLVILCLTTLTALNICGWYPAFGAGPDCRYTCNQNMACTGTDIITCKGCTEGPLQYPSCGE